VTRRLLIALMLTAVCIALSSCGAKEQVSQTGDFAALAKQFVEQLANGDFSAAVQNFDATMKVGMPPEKLKEAWEGLVGQVGALQKQAGVRMAKEQGFDAAYVTCEFERGKVDVKVVFNGAKEISGLWFVPPR